nr:hypothetical protein [uncultured Arsenicibacter sp.]
MPLQDTDQKPRIAPLTTAEASTEIRELWEKHILDYPGSTITNMKATLSHSALAFTVYMQWYPLYYQVIEIVGKRAAYLYAHAISEASDCPLCTTFFRKIIIDNGERPEDLLLSGDEQHLLRFGASIAQHRGEVPAAVYEPIRQVYNPAEIVVLTAFAGQMIATNLFNNALDVVVDDYLHAYLPLTKPQENE